MHSSVDRETNGRRVVRVVGSGERLDQPDPLIVNYKDSIKIINCDPYLKKLGIRWLRGASLWLVKDCCGIVCAVFTWSLIVFAEFVVWGILLLPSTDTLHASINGVIFQLFTSLAIASHLKAMFTDPGAVARGNATLENIAQLGLSDGEVVYRCPKCMCLKPSRAHHCRICRRCIRKMDHHCPWVNNCIGECNQKFFLLFLVYILIISVHAFYMTVRHFIVCLNGSWNTCTTASPILSTVMMVLLIVESIIFSIFTGVMFGSQLCAICDDETGIEQLKKEERSWEKQTRWQGMKAVFGSNFSIRWFSPFHSPPPSILSPEVYMRFV